MRTKQITQTMKDCYLIINNEVMRGMCELGKIEYLGTNIKKSNEYFGINRNDCLVGIIQDRGYGAYCIIDKYLKRYNGRKIYQVDILQQFSFHTASTQDKEKSYRERTRTSNKDEIEKLGYDVGTINIEQVIHTLRTGKISGRATGLEVHHEVSVFDHRITVTQQIPKILHKKADSKSKMNGLVINNINELAWLIQALEVSKIRKIPIKDLC